MEETPETVVGEKVVVKGNLAFETLLRIDGKVEGTLDCDGGNLIIGQTGTLVGNVEKMKNMLVDGTVRTSHAASGVGFRQPSRGAARRGAS